MLKLLREFIAWRQARRELREAITMWRAEVRRNRSRHPDLILEEERGADPFSIISSMMIRDRVAARELIEQGIPARYPDLWDYYVITSDIDLYIVRMRRTSRARDSDRLRAKWGAAPIMIPSI